MTLCSFVDEYQRFREKCCIHLQGRRVDLCILILIHSFIHTSIQDFPLDRGFPSLKVPPHAAVSSTLFCQYMFSHSPSSSVHPSIFLRVFPSFVFPLVLILLFSKSIYLLAFSLHVQTTVTVFIQLLPIYSSPSIVALMVSFRTF